MAGHYANNNRLSQLSAKYGGVYRPLTHHAPQLFRCRGNQTNSCHIILVIHVTESCNVHQYTGDANSYIWCLFI